MCPWGAVRQMPAMGAGRAREERGVEQDPFASIGLSNAALLEASGGGCAERAEMSFATITPRRDHSLLRLGGGGEALASGARRRCPHPVLRNFCGNSFHECQLQGGL